MKILRRKDMQPDVAMASDLVDTMLLSTIRNEPQKICGAAAVIRLQLAFERIEAGHVAAAIADALVTTYGADMAAEIASSAAGLVPVFTA